MFIMKLELIIKADREPRESDIIPILSILELIPIKELDNISVSDGQHGGEFESYNIIKNMYLKNREVRFIYDGSHEFHLPD